MIPPCYPFPQTSLVSLSLRNHLSLSILAKYMLMAKAALRPKLGRDRRIAQMPLILCIDSRADEENIVLPGTTNSPPHTLETISQKPTQNMTDTQAHNKSEYAFVGCYVPSSSLFGQAFEAGVRRTKARAQFCYFDNNCIELRREDMLKTV
ncbi:hypothetical protein AHF37_00304 [Paragonimus kellicotti]|nr:hypothetical protein AHF37_00304 [Paragonimus kellicotti]